MSEVGGQWTQSGIQTTTVTNTTQKSLEKRLSRVTKALSWLDSGLGKHWLACCETKLR